MSLWNGLLTLSHWFSVAIGVLLPVTGLVAFFLREKIKQRFARSVALELEKERAELARDQAKYSSELQREMEAYKVSLIAEGERIKAQQHVKTAVALRIAERKYAALSDINKEMSSLQYDLTHLLETPQGENPIRYEKKWATQVDGIVATHAVVDEASSFLSPTMLERCREFNSSVARALESRPGVDTEPLTAESQEMKRLSSAFENWRSQVDLEFRNLEAP